MKFSTNMNMKLLTAVAIGVFSFSAFAQEGQNIVPNGSFEQVDKKPKKLGSIESATSWVSPTGVRADLFAGSVEDVAVPNNAMGSEEAKDGSNYAGIVAFSYGNKVPRSYLLTKLDAPMKKGMRYCVKFYVSLAEASKYASNNIGVNFNKKPFGMDTKSSIIAEPSIMHFNNDHKIISARFNWTEICGQYTAEGGEKFITIGNFMSDEDTKSERMKKDNTTKVTQVISAYYYIDDISVVLLGDDERCECEVDDGGDDYSPTIYQKVFNITDEMSAKEKIEAHQVYFAFGKDKISAQGEETLNFIAETLKANPELKLEVIGHNNEQEDEVGAGNDYYADMDNKRIGSVMSALMELGVPENRMMFSRKGSTIPNDEVDETDDEDLQLAKSRRVTFKVR